MESPSKRLIFLCTRQAGKALHVDTPICTPEGWTPMGDLRSGDLVFDEMGNLCTITWTSEITMRETYIVKFSDGSEIVADGDHLWTTINAAARASLSRNMGDIPTSWASWKAEGRPLSKPRQNGEKKCSFEPCNNRVISKGLCTGHYQQQHAYGKLSPLIHHRPQTSTITTKEMLETISVTSRGDTNHAIPATNPLELPDVNLPMDPYLLGVWLGDGTSANGNLTINEADEDIVSTIRSRGYDVVKTNVRCRWRVEGLTRTLRDSGLINNKHIPKIYLRASYNQRLSLLRGLMDTDGYAGEKAPCEFCTTSNQISEGFYELATSLGFIVTVKESRAKLYGRDIGPKWRLFFSPSYPPFITKRKADRLKYNGPRKSLRKLRFVISIEPAGIAPVKCIAVSSPSKLYLAGKAMIPTHNSTTASIIALHRALFYPGSLILLISPSLRQSGELFKKVQSFYKMVPDQKNPPEDNKLSMTLENGSRVVSLPSSESNIRGFSAVDLVIEDEAARVDDDLYRAVRPMLAISSGKLILMSTPFGKRGHFFEEWENGGSQWEKITISAPECNRISPEFLEEEKRSLGEWWFAQEYLCEFRDTTDSLFKYDDIQEALSNDLEAWFMD